VEWSPSFEYHVRADGGHEYRIGHQLIDEFLEFVVGRARPNTVRAYAHDPKCSASERIDSSRSWDILICS